MVYISRPQITGSGEEVVVEGERGVKYDHVEHCAAGWR